MRSKAVHDGQKVLSVPKESWKELGGDHEIPACQTSGRDQKSSCLRQAYPCSEIVKHIHISSVEWIQYIYKYKGNLHCGSSNHNHKSTYQGHITISHIKELINDAEGDICTFMSHKWFAKYQVKKWNNGSACNSGAII